MPRYLFILLLILCSTYENATQSPLLLLPPEVRNRIYRCALGGNTLHVSINGRLITEPHGKPRVSLCTADADDVQAAQAIRDCDAPQPAPRVYDRHARCHRVDVTAGHRDYYSLTVLRTCKQIYKEASLLPFHLNTFSFDDAYDFSMFIDNLCPKQRKAVLNITLYGLRTILRDIWASEVDYLDGPKWKWCREALTGLRYVTVFEQVSFSHEDYFITPEEELSDQREWILPRLSTVTGSRLETVKICYSHSYPPSTDPELFSRHCEALETSWFELGSNE